MAYRMKVERKAGRPVKPAIPTTARVTADAMRIAERIPKKIMVHFLSGAGSMEQISLASGIYMPQCRKGLYPGSFGPLPSTGVACGPGKRVRYMAEDKSVIGELIRDLSNKDETVRWSSAFALARVGGPAVEALIRALGHADSVVRLRAAWALGQIGERKAIGPLTAALRDGDWSVRMRAVDALGMIGGHEVTRPILHMLHDQNADVRRHAIGALARLRDPASADSLGNEMKDKDWNVRMGAALVLMAIGDQKSLDILKTAVTDGNAYVRRIAETALRKGSGAEKTGDPA